MNANKITHLFKEGYDSSLPLEEKPTVNNLLTIQKIILPLLVVIPYDQLNRIHSLTANLTEAIKYVADHGNAKFIQPSHLPLYDYTLPMMPQLSAVFVQRPPINPALTTMPVTRWPNKVLLNSFVTSLLRSGTTISRMRIPSIERSWPSPS
jgi:hypothetical protein